MNRKRTLVALFVASLFGTMAMVWLFSLSICEPERAAHDSSPSHQFCCAAKP